MEFGVLVEDKITGFSGIVVGKVSYITGTDQIQVQPVCSEKGDYRESHWFDVDRLYVLNNEPIK